MGVDRIRCNLELGDDVKEAATKKLQEINKAKEMIFQARGLD